MVDHVPVVELNPAVEILSSHDARAECAHAGETPLLQLVPRAKPAPGDPFLVLMEHMVVRGETLGALLDHQLTGPSVGVVLSHPSDAVVAQ
jgi:hypothetical protein